jgi:hypothetical protein
MGAAVSAAVEYDAFWMLNSLVNQYTWHCVGLYNKLKPDTKPRLHYVPLVWSMNRLLQTPDESEVIKTLKTFVRPFPGIGAFGVSLFSTFNPYQGKDNVQKGGADIVRDVIFGAKVVGGYSIVRSFQLLNALWNEMRWYLLELRRLRKDPEVTGMEHTYITSAAAGPLGKLLRGKAMFRPIDDPTLNGLEQDPPLQRFIDEIHSGQQKMRRASSNTRKIRTSSERRRTRSQNRNRE